MREGGLLPPKCDIFLESPYPELSLNAHYVHLWLTSWVNIINIQNIINIMKITTVINIMNIITLSIMSMSIMSIIH